MEMRWQGRGASSHAPLEKLTALTWTGWKSPLNEQWTAGKVEGIWERSEGWRGGRKGEATGRDGIRLRRVWKKSRMRHHWPRNDWHPPRNCGTMMVWWRALWSGWFALGSVALADEDFPAADGGTWTAGSDRYTGRREERLTAFTDWRLLVGVVCVAENWNWNSSVTKTNATLSCRQKRKRQTLHETNSKLEPKRWFFLKSWEFNWQFTHTYSSLVGVVCFILNTTL